MLQVPSSGGTARSMITAVQQLIQGRNNAYGTVQLAEFVTETEVSSPVINENSVVLLSPRTLSASADVGMIYVQTVEPGRFVIEHNSSGDTRIFDWLALGG